VSIDFRNFGRKPLAGVPALRPVQPKLNAVTLVQLQCKLTTLQGCMMKHTFSTVINSTQTKPTGQNYQAGHKKRRHGNQVGIAGGG
jgi:hypothetical protein